MLDTSGRRAGINEVLCTDSIRIKEPRGNGVHPSCRTEVKHMGWLEADDGFHHRIPVEQVHFLEEVPMLRSSRLTNIKATDGLGVR